MGYARKTASESRYLRLDSSDAANSRDDDIWQGVDEVKAAASDAVPELMVDVQPQPTARSPTVQRRVRCSLGSARPPSYLPTNMR